MIVIIFETHVEFDSVWFVALNTRQTIENGQRARTPAIERMGCAPSVGMGYKDVTRTVVNVTTVPVNSTLLVEVPGVVVVVIVLICVLVLVPGDVVDVRRRVRLVLFVGKGEVVFVACTQVMAAPNKTRKKERDVLYAIICDSILPHVYGPLRFSLSLSCLIPRCWTRVEGHRTRAEGESDGS